MYRHAPLRLPCERCAVEQPTRAMILSPSGAGHLCWPCQLRGEIAEHQLNRPVTPARVMMMSAVLLFGMWLAVSIVELFAYLGHPC